MSEPIDWKALHPWQRDQLIAEKVMGVTDFLCTGKLTYDGNNALYRHHYYVCQACKVRLTVTEDYLEGCELPKHHTKLIPAYSESMDAAWLIVKHFDDCLERDERTYMLYSERFLSRIAPYLTESNDEAIFSLSGLAELTPEKICIASLSAIGIEVK